MSEYIRFIRENKGALTFGWSLTFFSSFGQTFFISLFVPSILAAFELSKSAFGAYYAAATITASLILLNYGHTVDTRPIGRLTLMTTGLLLLASLLLALAIHPAMLFVALIGLRLGGQGFLSHISLSVMSRRFVAERGKALSVTSLGYPAGEILFPLVFGTLISLAGWHYTLLVVAVLLSGIILLYYRTDLAIYDVDPSTETRSAHKWTYYGELLGTLKFWIMIAPTVAFGFTTTALFFYQYVMAEEKGWSVEWYSICFAGYAIARLFAMLSSGPLVDSFSARAMFPFFSLPCIIGLMCLAWVNNPFAPLLFLVMTGLSSGLSNVLATALIAEIYGTARIGQVRSLFSMFGIMSTAVAPLTLGIVLDHGFSFGQFALGCALLLALAMGSSFWINKNVGYWNKKPR